jgi:Ni,Fe-hydrogenase III large subunit
MLAAPVETRCTEGTAGNLAPDCLVVTVNEAWRGELSHCLLTDSAGKLQRYKVKDPSFHNWGGLAMSLRDTEISDFPLNNKSYNLSYCGFDL